MVDVETNIKKIMEDVKYAGFEKQVSKKDLLLIISKYTLSPYGYLNRLCIMNIIQERNDKVFDIL
jgi:hypothetical protein